MTPLTINDYQILITLLAGLITSLIFAFFVYVKGMRAKYVKKGITHAYKHFENEMKIGKIQHRKLLVLFNQMKKEALQKYGD